MNYTKEEKEYYKAQRERTCERLGLEVYQYNYLRRLGNKWQSVAVANCNGEKSEAQFERETLAIERMVLAYVGRINPDMQIYYQTDSRGATLYLSQEKMNGSNYNSVGLCIY